MTLATRLLTILTTFIAAVLLGTLPALAASDGEGAVIFHISPLTPGAVFCLIIFVLAYAAVLVEEYTHMRKSKPVMLAAGLIWLIIGIMAPQYGISRDDLHTAVMHGLEEYAALLLFLLAAMTYINALEERQVFATLRAKLVQAGLNLRQLFWATGVIAFFLSPVADNLTTALVLGAVIMAVARHDVKFVSMACINVVNAANAGGAFSPFGDITTLMVWQAGHVDFFEFFDLFLPAAACFLVPAVIMSFFVSTDLPEALKTDIKIKKGGKLIIALGIGTIATAVAFENVLGLPPFLGMLTGMSVLMMTAYYLKMSARMEGRQDHLDILHMVSKAEWDTLLFFFGVIFCVGGLSFLGYMELASSTMYEGLGASMTNIFLGIASAVVDNIPVMFAVLSMEPDMPHFQWMLITLTTGVGGSMLSIGSAAGVALMGTARGKYTFFRHLKWTPVLALGYAAAIAVHFWFNGHNATLLSH